jgi:putative ABC transport system permease protein
MIKNYIKIALRKALLYRIYSLITVVGLAIGMASFLFISKYVALERQVDHFHEYFPHIYRLQSLYSF